MFRISKYCKYWRFVSLLCFSGGVNRVQMKVFGVLHQVQHGAGLAAAVALLRPVSSQPASPEARSAISGVEAQRAAGF